MQHCFLNNFTYHIYNHKNSCDGVSSEKNPQTDAVQGVGVEREERVTLNTRVPVIMSHIFF